MGLPAALCLYFPGHWTLPVVPASAFPHCALSRMRMLLGRLWFHALSALHFHAQSRCRWWASYLFASAAVTLKAAGLVLFPSSLVQLVPQEPGSRGEFISVGLFLAWCFWPCCWCWRPLCNVMVWSHVTRRVAVCGLRPLGHKQRILWSLNRIWHHFFSTTLSVACLLLKMQDFGWVAEFLCQLYQCFITFPPLPPTSLSLSANFNLRRNKPRCARSRRRWLSQWNNYILVLDLIC